jgi:hypothetical protein
MGHAAPEKLEATVAQSQKDFQATIASNRNNLMRRQTSVAPARHQFVSLSDGRESSRR